MLHLYLNEIVSKTQIAGNKTLKDYIPADIKNIANQNSEDVAKVLRSLVRGITLKK